MEVVNPYGKEGLFEDWELVEKIWDHTLKKCLLVDPTEHPMLIAEPAHATAKHREKVHAQLQYQNSSICRLVAPVGVGCLVLHSPPIQGIRKKQIRSQVALRALLRVLVSMF